MFDFFGHIAHVFATFVVSVLIGSGLAVSPIPTNNPVLQQPATSTATTSIAEEQISTSTQTINQEHKVISQTQSQVTHAVSQTKIEETPVPNPAPTPTAPPAVISNIEIIPTSQTDTITVTPDTLGIVSSGLEAFYNVSSDSNSEIDLKTLQASVTGIKVSDGWVVSINDDTNNQLLVASSQAATYDPLTKTLNINATFNKPLKILSGYPTMFDITVTNVSPYANNPTITIKSVGSTYIFKPSSAVLKNNLRVSAQAYYQLNMTCVGLEGDAFSDCVTFSLNQ
jgi:hypothetical protein